MKNLHETVQAFNTLIRQQQWKQALDSFYDENIVSVSNENEPVKGSDTLKRGLADFEGNTKDISLTLKNVIVSDDLSVVEWHYIFTLAQRVNLIMTRYRCNGGKTTGSFMNDIIIKPINYELWIKN